MTGEGAMHSCSREWGCTGVIRADQSPSRLFSQRNATISHKCTFVQTGGLKKELTFFGQIAAMREQEEATAFGSCAAAADSL